MKHPFKQQQQQQQQLLAESAILLHRNFRNVIRTPELFFVRVGLCVVMGLVLGSLFWNVQVGWY
jgi:hypothetical protein